MSFWWCIWKGKKQSFLCCRTDCSRMIFFSTLMWSTEKKQPKFYKEDIPLKSHESGYALHVASGTNHRHVLHRFWGFCLKGLLPQHRTITTSTYCWQELPSTSTSFLTQDSNRELEMISSMTPLILFSAGAQIFFHLYPVSQLTDFFATFL